MARPLPDKKVTPDSVQTDSPLPAYVQYHDLNLKGRDFVVGDIHGCLEPLHRLLKSVHFQPRVDRLFAVGDLIDRGPMSYHCMRLLKQPWFYSCLGNHEIILIEHLKDISGNRPHDSSWLDEVAPTLKARKALAEEWLDILENLPRVIVVGAGSARRFQVVHAEILEDGRGVTNALIDSWMFRDGKKAAYRAIWGRALISAFLHNKPVKRAHTHDEKEMSITYCGHTIVPTVIQLAQQVYLDRGAFLGRKGPAHHMDIGEMQYKIEKAGLVLAEPATGQFWFAETQGDTVTETSCQKPKTL